MSSVSEIMSEKEIATLVADTGKSAQDVAQMMVKKKVGSIIIIDKRSQSYWHRYRTRYSQTCMSERRCSK